MGKEASRPQVSAMLDCINVGAFGIDPEVFWVEGFEEGPSKSENILEKPASDPDRRRTKMYKLAVMGTCSVGKTALTVQFTKNRFVTEYDLTIQNLNRKQTMVDKEQCQLHIMDTRGIEEYYPLRNQAMLWGEGFLLVYAVNDFYSFQNVSVLWDHLQGIKGTNHVPVVLVANKVDMSDRLVNPTRGQEVAKRLGVPYVETSAKTGQGVEQAFHELVREIQRIRAEE
ncbi:GTPase NRas-like [Sarcophilus harrisii]